MAKNAGEVGFGGVCVCVCVNLILNIPSLEWLLDLQVEL